MWGKWFEVNPMNLRGFWLFSAAFLFAVPVLSQAASDPVLKVAHTSGTGYPLVTLDGNRVNGGLLRDLGELIALRLGTRAQHVLMPRGRMEKAIEVGEAHIVCYSSPGWSSGAVGNWTRHVLPQIERAVTLAENAPPQKTPDDFIGKRMAVMTGYHFAPIQPLFERGETQRVNDTKVENLFQRVKHGQADALIASEAEIEGYFKQRPKERARYAIGRLPFTVVQTQCLVSPRSPWSVAAINTALAEMEQAGEIERLARRYGMSVR